MSNGITMKSIAAQAGVTQATVSMSLANNPRIPVATRERIQAIARRLGYHPNPYVSTLMRIRRQGKPLKDKPALALVCALNTADGWRNHPPPQSLRLDADADPPAGKTAEGQAGPGLGLRVTDVRWLAQSPTTPIPTSRR